MTPEELKQWRKDERTRLVALRLAQPRDTIDAWRRRMDEHLLRSFPGLARGVLAVCWPIRNEYDPRHVARRLREAGATTVLPVVVAPRQPLLFREWHPGVQLAKGAMDIPYPVETPEMAPDHVLLPMNGWDRKGYRLGYGAGFFDRTLASLARRPVVIGVSFELAAMDSIHPQPWDIPVDYLVTERGVYRRDPEGLRFAGG